MKTVKFAMIAALALICDLAVAQQNNLPSVFGLPLGQPIALPQCKTDSPEYGLKPHYRLNSNRYMDEERCWQHRFTDFTGLAGTQLGVNEVIEVYFPLSEKLDPGLILGSLMDLIIMDGKAEGASWTTIGKAAPYVLTKLTEKFGKPSSTEAVTLQNGMGARFSTIYAIWKTDTFSVLFKGLDESIKEGRVRIKTKTLLDRESSETKKLQDSSTKL